MSMKILVIGGGGREHALVTALARSPGQPALYCAPGNPGIAELATCCPIAADDVDALLSLAQALPPEPGAGPGTAAKADLVVIGPEAPLTLGLADRLRAVGIAVCGPSAAAAQLEGSKAFTKAFCDRHAIPTAAYATFTDAAAARDHVLRQGAPIVIKADGLAAGKGVVVAMTESEALEAVDAAMVDGTFGDAGTTVVIEEFMTGPEASVFALCDGANALLLATAHDYKRVGDQDQGPNTGGMGSVSPTPRLTPGLEAQVMAEIIGPTIAGMAAEGMPFVGVLYAGLMMTAEGPKLVEYNVRFGDPECQVLMARLNSDAAELLLAAAEGRLGNLQPEWRGETAVCVVMAAEGYPGSTVKGSIIKGLDAAGSIPGVSIIHAGTARRDDGALIAAGGRVLGVTALAPTTAEAREKAYEAVARIDWPEGFCRYDIGLE
jgi:phosphoribosylamine---glycine ligase